MRRLIYGCALAAALVLAGCASGPPDAVIIDSGAKAPDPCPSTAVAAAQPKPADPATSAEREQQITATVNALPEDRAVKILEYDTVTIPGWGQRGWNRVADIQAWCAKRK